MKDISDLPVMGERPFVLSRAEIGIRPDADITQYKICGGYGDTYRVQTASRSLGAFGHILGPFDRVVKLQVYALGRVVPEAIPLPGGKAYDSSEMQDFRRRNSGNVETEHLAFVLYDMVEVEDLFMVPTRDITSFLEYDMPTDNLKSA